MGGWVVELSGMRVVWVRQVGGWRRGGEMGMVVLGAGMGWDGEVGVKVGLKGKGWEGKRWVGSGNGMGGEGRAREEEVGRWKGKSSMPRQVCYLVSGFRLF